MNILRDHSQPDRPVLGYILKGYPRISETFISNEIFLLEQLGFSMHLFPMRRPRENFSHNSVKQIKAPVHYLPTELLLDFPRLLLPNIFLAVKSVSRYRYSVAAAARRFRRSRSLATLKHLFQAGFLVNNHLGANSPVTHLHGHFAHSPTSVTLFASLLSGLPFSFTAHAKDIYTSKKEQLREKIDMAAFVVTCTNHNLDYLRDLAPDSTTDLFCVYHGIDTKLFQNETRPADHPEPFRLLTVARMTEKKGLPVIYHAIKILKERGMNLNHTLIGDGDDKEKILQLIKKLDLEDCCNCLGTLPHDKVLGHFRDSDLFVLGCRIAENGDRDGIPNVLVESLAMGVPALSTRVSAIGEILVNDETGLTVAPDDPLAMADSIQRLANNRDLRLRLSRKGRPFVETHFNNRTLIKNLADIFQHHGGKVTCDR
ncbi:MAG: glycosyltransferase family 4 protein [Thermodesulfobacteriota bacterium]